MKKLILTYGLIAGFIVSAMLLLTFSAASIDFEYGELLGYATMIIAFSTIYFAVKSHRDNKLDGGINFGEAFKIGLSITLVATILYIITWMIISNTIAKDFMADYFQQSIAELKASNLSETEQNVKITEMENFRELYKNPLVKIGMTFLEIFPVGFVVSLISAFLLKQKAA